MKYSESRLNISIVPNSLRWPEAGTGPIWQDLHGAVAALRETIVGVDEQVTAVEQDQDLSEKGRLRKIATIALNGLTDVRKDPRVTKAQAAVASLQQRLGQKVKSSVTAPTTAFDIAIGAEIRAAIRGMDGRKGFEFVSRHAGDERVLAAVLTAPAFLSGLADADLNMIRAREESRLNPEAAATIDAIGKALAQLEAGIAMAEKMIAERGQLRHTGESWEPAGLAA